MTTVSSSIIINCPIQNVFNYIIYPQNGPKYNSFLKETSDFEPSQPYLGQTFNWRYFMGGMTMKGAAKVIELTPNQKYIIDTTGDILSTWTYLLNEEPEGVKLTMSISYEFDQNYVKKIINQLILNSHNQRAIDTSLENLKALLEA
jgi:uncharacterized membrane protein